MTRLVFIGSLFFLMLPAVRAAETAPLVRAIPAGEQAAFQDRSAPSTYQYDNAPANNSIGPVGGENLVIHRYDAVGGADLISSISVAWNFVPNGTPARVFVWQDNGSGNPVNATLLWQQSITVQSTSSGALNEYVLSNPVAVTGSFFVGASVVTPVATYPFPVQVGPTPPYVNGRTFYGGTSTPPIDPKNLGAVAPLPVRDLGAGYLTPSYVLLRARGSGSAFSYQGRLNNAGAPYSGTADMRFTIYDSETGGNPVTPTATQSNIAVIGGIFSVQIPVDASTFVSVPDRYLDVAVATPSGSGTFVPILPRTRIGQVPAAMVATQSQYSLFSAGAPWEGIAGIPDNVASAFSPWVPATGGIRYGDGNAGIGVSSPLFRLHVASASDNVAAQLESASTIGTWLNLRNASAGGTYWHLISTGSTNPEGVGKLLIGSGSTAGGNTTTMILQSNGRVGIGVNNPEQALAVNGSVQIQTGAGASNSLVFGTVGNTLSTAENTDLVALTRVNVTTGASNSTDLRLIIGDDNSSGPSADFFTIGTIPGGVWNPTFGFRSDGLASKPGGGSWAAISDPRTKHDVSPLRGTLDRLLTLRGYQYFYNEAEIKNGRALPGMQIGLMADEVERVFPDWVTRDRDGMRMVTERSTTALMVEALRDLRAEKDAQIESLRVENAALKARLERLEQLMERRER
ncbi:MAG: tail fiber domain-containing protein [Phycisphaerales bacterium]|nr:tail fiber domain-containing protein [Planctomycetota bacterium]